jgi:two-component system chemotaxis response regulator CheY
MVKKVLVADDDLSVRTSLIRAIEAICTSDVLEARDGDEAVQLCEENEFDLIVLDWDMPGRSGLEVLKTIRGNDSQTLVLMLARELHRERVVEAIQNGVSDCLTKPFDQRVLVAKLKSLCHGGRASGNVSA